jgi:hypothetical protein
MTAKQKEWVKKEAFKQVMAFELEHEQKLQQFKKEGKP